MLPKIRPASTELSNLSDLILGLLVSSIFWPICLILYIINVSLRYLVQTLYEHFYPGRYIICDGEDGVFGTKVKGNCNSLIQGYQIVKGTPDVTKIREKFQKMLDTTEDDFARFKNIFTHKFGYYCWEKDYKFAINKHIRYLDTWDPNREADERKILDITGDFASQAMPNTKPQWEILVIPKYRLEGQSQNDPCDHYVLLTRFNHAYSDAISYFLMVNKYIADSPAELPMDPTKPFKVPIWAKAFIWAKVFLQGPFNFVSIMATYVFDVSVYRATYYSDSKWVARSPVIELDTIKKIKKESGASVTAVLFTAVYSALYKSHLKLYPKEQVPRDLHLGNVMAMFPYWEKKKMGNQFTLWPYCAPLAVGDLKQRLQITNELTQKGIGSPDPVFDFYMTRALGSLPKVLHTLLWSLSGSPIMLSNVPGFNTKLKLYGGEMVDGAGFIPLMSTTGVGLSTQSYCGALRFNAVVDPKVFPRRSDLQTFLNEVIEEIEKLAEIYNIISLKNSSELISTLTTTEKMVKSPIYRKHQDLVNLINPNPKPLQKPHLRLDDNGNEILEEEELSDKNHNIININNNNNDSKPPRTRRINGKEESDDDDPKVKKAAEDFNKSRKFLAKSIL